MPSHEASRMNIATRILSGLWIALSAFQAIAGTQETPQLTFKQSAEMIRHTYESQFFTLETAQQNHYGLCMYRQTLDAKRYATSIENEWKNTASTLNYFADHVHTPEQIVLYAQHQLAPIRERQDERSQRRYNVTKNTPEYLYLGPLITAIAHIDEYGLEHRKNHKLRNVLRRYDFNKYATSKPMIEAWGPQLATQVFGLRDLGEQNVVQAFILHFRRTYPDDKDASLTAQQYRNKIATMTHIIAAQSHRYQNQVSAHNQQWILNYFRQHIDTILLRATPNLIAQIGISFLLVGLDDDVVVQKAQQAVRKAINAEDGMIPSSSGQTNLSQGEQRNSMAIMLLDWRGVHAQPSFNSTSQFFTHLPSELIKKHSSRES